LCFVFSGCVAQAKTECSQDWACVDFDRNDSAQVDVFLRNNKPYTITMTVDFKPHNMVVVRGGDQDDTLTKTINGHDRVWVGRYKPVNTRRSSDIDVDIEWAVGSLNVIHDEHYLYRLPFAKTASYYVVQGFNGGYSHRGMSRYAVDFAMPDGTELYAAREGVVVDVEYSNHLGGASREYIAHANYIVIEHSDGSTGEYHHLQENGVFVHPGEKVKRGQLIGLSGSTGFTSLPHLHFAVYKAMPDGDTQSLAFKFVAADGVVNKPLHGKRYVVADE
jgi:murein DD-endopeptidase MepM/ murein hydrolase activator NlpD